MQNTFFLGKEIQIYSAVMNHAWLVSLADLCSLTSLFHAYPFFNKWRGNDDCNFLIFYMKCCCLTVIILLFLQIHVSHSHERTLQPRRGCCSFTHRLWENVKRAFPSDSVISLRIRSHGKCGKSLETCSKWMGYQLQPRCVNDRFSRITAQMRPYVQLSCCVCRYCECLVVYLWLRIYISRAR